MLLKVSRANHNGYEQASVIVLKESAIIDRLSDLVYSIRHNLSNAEDKRNKAKLDLTTTTIEV